MQTFECQFNSLKVLAFSRHDNQLAFSGYLGIIEVWDLATEASKLLEGHKRSVEDIAFSPDGKQLASASHDQTLKLWDLTSTNPEIKSFGGLRWLEDNDFVIIAQDGMHLARVRGRSKRLQVGYLTSDYNLETNLADFDIRNAKCVAFSPDGRQLAVACKESILLWNLTSQPFPKRTISRNCTLINTKIALAFSQNGGQLACVDGMGILTLWDLTSCPIKQECIKLDFENWQNVSTIKFSPDDKQLAIASLLVDTIEIWDLTSTPLKRRNVLRTPVSVFFAMAFCKDGKQLASAGLDGMIRLHDLTTDFDSSAELPKNGVGGLEFSQNARQLVSFMNDGTLRVLDSETGKDIGMLEVLDSEKKKDIETRESASPQDFQFLYHSQRNSKLDLTVRELNSGRKETVVRLWDLASDPIRNREVARLPSGYPGELSGFPVLFDDDKQLACILKGVGSPDVTKVGLWDLTHNPVKMRQIEVLGQMGECQLLFSTDGKKLVLYQKCAIIIISDLTSNPVQQRSIFEEVGLPPKGVPLVTFSHDNNQLASLTSDGIIMLWDLIFNPVRTKEVRPYERHINAIALSPRSEQLALATYDGWIELWDLTSSVPAKPKKIPFDAYVTELSFSCDGKYLNTDRGQFPLPLNATPDSPNVPPLLFVRRSWVSKDGEDILWLPDEHRSEYVAVHESMIGYVTQSEQTIIIKFDFSKPFD